MRIIVGLYLIYLAAPIALLFVGSLGATWTNTLLPSGLTDRWYLQVIGDSSFQRAFFSSLKVVSAACIVDALIGVPLAYAISAGAQRKVQVAARVASLLPIAVPQLVLAFGLILVFSTSILPLLGSIWLLIAAHVVITLPYLLNTLLPDIRHLKLAEMERVAETLGAGFTNRFFDIVLPSLRYSILSGLIMASAISIGEFEVSNLVSGFLTRTYPVVLLQAFYGATGFACAATVILLVLAFLAAAAGSVTARVAHGTVAGDAS